MGRRLSEETGRPPQHRVNSSPCFCRLSISPDRTSSISPSSFSFQYNMDDVHSWLVKLAGGAVQCAFLLLNDVSIAESHRRLAAPIADAQALSQKGIIKIKKKRKRKETNTHRHPRLRRRRPESIAVAPLEKNRRKSNGVVCQLTRTEKIRSHDIRTRTGSISLILSRTLSFSLSL